MGGYMPSEVARMVLGYLKETNCPKTKDVFLHESYNLKEYAECLKQGHEYPTTIAGKGLRQILQDYYVLTHLDLDSKGDKECLLSDLDKALIQVKYLVNSRKIDSQETRQRTLDLGVNKRQNFVRQQVKKKLLFAKHNAARTACAKETQVNLLPRECQRRDVESVSRREDNNCKMSFGTRESEEVELPRSSVVNSVRVENNQHPLRNVQDVRSQKNNFPDAPSPSVANTKNVHTNDAFLQSVNSQRSAHSSACSSPKERQSENQAVGTLKSDTRNVRNVEATFRFPSQCVTNTYSIRRTPYGNNEKIPNRDAWNSIGVQQRNNMMPKNVEHTNDRTANHYENVSTPHSSLHPVSSPSREKMQYAANVSSPIRNIIVHTSSAAVNSPLRREIPTTNLNVCHFEKRVYNQKGRSQTIVQESNCKSDGLQTANSKMPNATSKNESMCNPGKTPTGSYQRINPTPVRNCSNLNDGNTSSQTSENIFHPPETIPKDILVPHKKILQPENKQNEVSQERIPATNGKNFHRRQRRHSDSGLNHFSSGNNEKETEKLQDTNLISSTVCRNETDAIQKEKQGLESNFNDSPDLMISESVTPQNSVQPELPSRYPEHCDSPRYILSQQRAAIPSLTTPIKDHNADSSFYSPRRKSHIPRRRLLPTSSPLASQQNQQQEAEPILEELINFPPLMEKIAENINKVVQSDSNPETSELEATISSQGIHIPDAVIKDILMRTESDPVFEEVLSFLCEKYDSSRDSIDGAQSNEIQSSPLDNNFQDAPQSENNKETSYHDSTQNGVVIIPQIEITPPSKETFTCIDAINDNVPQISIPENAEIVLTDDNLLALKNGANVYVATAGTTGGSATVHVTCTNAVVSNESQFGTCIQVLDKPIMSTLNPQTGGTYVMNAAAITPMKIAIPDFHFLTLSPSHIFGMPTLFVDSTMSPDKKGQTMLFPKTSSTTSSPNNRSNHQKVLLGNSLRRPINKKNIRKPETNKQKENTQQKPQHKVLFDDSVISRKNRISRAHVRSLNFGASITTETQKKPENIETKGGGENRETASTSKDRAVDLTRASSEQTRRADADVAATLVSLAHSTRREQAKPTPKDGQSNNKKHKGNYEERAKRKGSYVEQAKKRKRIQDNLKDMDVDKFLSKIHALK